MLDYLIRVNNQDRVKKINFQVSSKRLQLYEMTLVLVTQFFSHTYIFFSLSSFRKTRGNKAIITHLECYKKRIIRLSRLFSSFLFTMFLLHSFFLLIFSLSPFLIHPPSRFYSHLRFFVLYILSRQSLSRFLSVPLFHFLDTLDSCWKSEKRDRNL